MTLSARSQVALFASVFFTCVSFSVVLPTLWPYLASMKANTGYLALVVAIYSTGEATGALLFGALCAGKSSAISMAVATLVGVVGYVLYVCAPRFGPAGAHFVLVARALHGVWTGAVQALAQVYLASVLHRRSLSAFTVTKTGFANLGFLFGPLFALLASLVPSFPTAPGLKFDQLTAPGYFVLLSGVVNVWLYLGVLDERRDRTIADAAARNELEKYPIYTKDEELPLLADASRVLDRPHRAAFLPGTIICNIMCFTHFLGFAIQETIITPFVQKLFNWSVMSANKLFTVGGATSLLGVIILAFATRVMSDRVLTALTLCVGASGYILLLSSVCSGSVGAASEPLFVGGFLLCMLAFSTGRAAVLSLYTKILPARIQGLGQGVFLVTGALARAVGPFLAVSAVGSDAGWVFGGTATAFFACLTMLGVLFQHLDTDPKSSDADECANAVG